MQARRPRRAVDAERLHRARHAVPQVEHDHAHRHEVERDVAGAAEHRQLQAIEIADAVRRLVIRAELERHQVRDDEQQRDRAGEDHRGRRHALAAAIVLGLRPLLLGVALRPRRVAAGDEADGLDDVQHEHRHAARAQRRKSADCLSSLCEYSLKASGPAMKSRLPAR